MSLSLDTIARSGIMDPQLEYAVSQRPLPDMSNSLSDKRSIRAAHLNNLRHMLPIPTRTDEIEERECYVQARDGHDVKITIYRKSTNRMADREGRPLVVLIHEGGWCMGDLDDEASNARLFARELNCICINVEYRLAPEYPFPTGVLDCWDVIKWAAGNGSDIGAAPENGFIVGGSSAGGNISAVLAILAVETSLEPPITGQWLSVPFLFPSEHVPRHYVAQYSSMWQNKSDPVLPAPSESDSMVTTSPNITKLLKADIDSPLFSVFAQDSYLRLKASAGKSKLAKAFFQVAGLDPLRDQALVYEQVIREDWGVPTRLNLYGGFGHMFWTNWPELQRSNDYWVDMVAGMRWLLE